jgi:hypothetical protein
MVSERIKYTGAGAIVCFVVSLGTAIPGIGLFIGPLFTFGGGFLGGGVAGGLQTNGGTEGAKLGFVAAVVGGVASSVIAVVVGTVLNVWMVSAAGTGGATEPWVWIMYAIIGFISGLIFTVVGGLTGGALAGFLRGSA